MVPWLTSKNWLATLLEMKDLADLVGSGRAFHDFNGNKVNIAY